MKKNNILIVIAILIAVLVTPLKGFAATDNIKILIDGKIVEFNNSTGYPFTDVNGRTQVPFRITLEKFGAKVDWNQVKSTAVAEKNGVKVEVPIGQNYIIRNGQRIETDTVALVKESKTYLPIRAVIEALEGIVTWDNSTSSVIIKSIIKKEIKNSEIIAFNIPKALEETRLTKEEVDALVGKSPSEIQDKVDTVYDLLQYMKSAGYDDISGDIQRTVGNISWHTNIDAESTILSNKGNCGATSNLANYILKGDYEEVGYMVFSADRGQGGHVFNYVKQNGMYYVIDFLQFAMKNYTNVNYRVWEVNDLKEYNDECIRGYSQGGKVFQIKVIVSYTADSQLPIGANMSGDGVMRYLPKNTNVRVLYETPIEGKVIEFVDAP